MSQVDTQMTTVFYSMTGLNIYLSIIGKKILVMKAKGHEVII